MAYSVELKDLQLLVILSLDDALEAVGEYAGEYAGRSSNDILPATMR